MQAALHSDAHETEGGLACNNDELLRVQQKQVSRMAVSTCCGLQRAQTQQQTTQHVLN